MNIPLRPLITALAFLLIGVDLVRAYLVGPPVPLDKLTQQSDLIFKGTVLSESLADPSGFSSVPAFLPFETRFKIISVIKGDDTGGTVSFRHYDQDPKSQMCMYEPQYYHFKPGQTYLVFASRLKTDPPGVYRQVWMSHTGMGDEGALLCADEKPVSEKSIQAIFWSELTGLLKSSQPEQVVYAIKHLDQLSRDKHEAFDSLKEFNRDEVVTALKDLPHHPNPDIAQAALLVIGSNNPYMTAERTPFWLGTVGGADNPGLSKMDPKMKNEGAAKYAKDLISLADSRIPGSTRALDILSLGLTRDPAIKDPLLRWLADPAPEVRAAATTLLADFPDLATSDRLTALSTDPAAEVRLAAARAIGFGQYVDQVGLLSTLLSDQDPKVRQLAAMSLLSFSPKEENLAKIFRANLANREFAPLFLLALARDNPAPYRDGLAEIITKNASPSNWGGGQIPGYTAFHLLFKYLQAQPVDDLTKGKLDRYLDAIEQVGNYSSSEPRDIYAFYVQRGLSDRAKEFRDRVNQKATYDMNYYFNQVDANPSLYQGQ